MEIRCPKCGAADPTGQKHGRLLAAGVEAVGGFNGRLKMEIQCSRKSCKAIVLVVFDGEQITVSEKTQEALCSLQSRFLANASI